MNFLSAY